MRKLFRARRERADARRDRNPTRDELLAEAALLALDDLSGIYGGGANAFVCCPWDVTGQPGRR
jgi:hypothetical protein